MKELFIPGLDPGTTLAYAILDIDGKLVRVESSREIKSSKLTLKLMEVGRIVIVACDVNPPSKFVVNFAKKIGAKLIYPEEDMSIIYKRNLTTGYKIKNKHEMDALASAIFAYKKIEPLLEKVEESLRKNKEEEFSTEAKRLILMKQLNIKDSIKK